MRYLPFHQTMSRWGAVVGNRMHTLLRGSDEQAMRGDSGLCVEISMCLRRVG